MWSILAWSVLLWLVMTSAHSEQTAISSSPGSSLLPPVPIKRPVTFSAFNHKRVDDYWWLRDDHRSNPEVLAYAQAENQYFDQVTRELQPLQEELLDEFDSRWPLVESSVPLRRGSYLYYKDLGEHDQFWKHRRQKVKDGSVPHLGEALDPMGPVEEVLDPNKECASVEGFCDVDGIGVSPDETRVVFGVDRRGEEHYTMFVRDLLTGQLMTGREGPALAADTSGKYEWGPDSQSLFLVTLDPVTHRPCCLWHYDLASGHRSVILEEKDEGISVKIGKSATERFLLVMRRSQTTLTISVLDLNQPADTTGLTPFKLIPVGPQEPHTQITLSHWAPLTSPAGPQEHESRSPAAHVLFFVLVHNQQELVNGEMWVIRRRWNPLEGSTEDEEERQVLIPHDSDVVLDDILVTQQHLVIQERRRGLTSIRVVKLGSISPSLMDRSGPADWSPILASFHHSHLLPPAITDTVHTVDMTTAAPYGSSIVRLSYESLISPMTIVDVDLETRQQVVRQVEEVLGGFRQADYVTERLWATSHDGVEVPLVVAYNRKYFNRDGDHPCLMKAYGAYGSKEDPHFDRNNLALLDRGWLLAVAQVRGGGDLGGAWHAGGALLNKRNTFLDTIACAEHLIAQNMTGRHRLALWGRSAGGLLVGAVLNLRRDLFRSAIMDVPFVDVLSDMMDPDLFLTVEEWEEWGDPLHNESHYRYMSSYCPVTNVPQLTDEPFVPYPHLLMTAGLYDPRVNFWEPLKYMAKVREYMKGGKNPSRSDETRWLLLKVDMSAGHASNMGTTSKRKATAMKFAFLLATVEFPQRYGLEGDLDLSAQAPSVAGPGKHTKGVALVAVLMAVMIALGGGACWAVQRKSRMRREACRGSDGEELPLWGTGAPSG